MKGLPRLYVLFIYRNKLLKDLVVHFICRRSTPNLFRFNFLAMYFNIQSKCSRARSCDRITKFNCDRIYVGKTKSINYNVFWEKKAEEYDLF